MRCSYRRGAGLGLRAGVAGGETHGAFRSGQPAVDCLPLQLFSSRKETSVVLQSQIQEIQAKSVVEKRQGLSEKATERMAKGKKNRNREGTNEKGKVIGTGKGSRGPRGQGKKEETETETADGDTQFRSDEGVGTPEPEAEMKIVEKARQSEK